jgi:hypothetical protein
MLKPELIKLISDRNPHLYQRDVENIVNAILGEIIAAMARGDRVELRAKLLQSERASTRCARCFFHSRYQTDQRRYAMGWISCAEIRMKKATRISET